MAKSVIILGAGMAGLGAGLRLSGHDACRVTILEKDKLTGGMAATLFKDDCILDYGVHGLFVSREGSEEIVEELKGILKDKLLVTNKKTAIFFNKRYVTYPLGLKELFSALSPYQMMRCFIDFVVIRVKRRLGFTFDERSFQGWISARFGKSLCNLYFGPYSEKVWGIPADTLDAEPLVRRVATVSLWDVIKRAVKKILGFARGGKEKYSQQPVTFLYGVRGAYSITRAIQDLIEERNGKILLSHTVTKINTDDGMVKSVEVVDGDTRRTYDCDYLVSTMRITDLVRCMDPLPNREILASADKLIYRGLIFVFLIVDTPRIYDDQWIYYSDSDIVFNRVNEFKNLHEFFAPPDKTALCAEITCFEGDATWNMGDEEIYKLTVRDMQRLNLLTFEYVSGYLVRRLPAIYPFYDLETV